MGDRRLQDGGAARLNHHFPIGTGGVASVGTDGTTPSVKIPDPRFDRSGGLVTARFTFVKVVYRNFCKGGIGIHLCKKGYAN